MPAGHIGRNQPVPITRGSNSELVATMGGHRHSLQEVSTPSASTDSSNGPYYDDITLLHGIILFMMQAGFITLEAGHGRAKNIINICLKNVVDALLCAVAWWAVGFAFAYGDTASGVIGTTNFLYEAEAPVAKPWFFTWVFALSTATIASGCLAERTQFQAYPVYTLAVVALIHPIAVHWVWASGGWLSRVNADVQFLDFAGGTLVHAIGGLVGLTGAIIVGPRIGRFEDGGRSKEIRGHDMSLISTGTFLLWFGWYGFNVGSVYLYSSPGAMLASRVATNMTLTASGGGLAALVAYKLIFGKGTFDLRTCCNGLLSGLVAGTALVGFCSPWAALVAGVLAGLLYVCSSRLLVYLRIDDPMDSAPVHLGSGVLGTILIGFLARPSYVQALTQASGGGVVYGGEYGGTQLGMQLLGVVAILAWTSITIVPMWLLMSYFGLLRVDQATELAGIDTFDHGGPAYPEFMHTNGARNSE